jgi:MFS family permease
MLYIIFSAEVRGSIKLKNSASISNTAVPVLWSKEFCMICLANLFVFVGFQLLMPTFPLYVEKMGGSTVAVGLAVGLFSVSAIIIRPLTGKFVDQGGRKKFFIVGLLISLLIVLGYLFAGSLLILLGLRLLHGFGFGMATTSAGTIASDLIPKQRLAEGMGFYGLTNAFSMAVSPAIGLFIVYNFDFNILFTTAAAFTIIALSIGYLLKTPHIEKKSSTKEYKYLETRAFLPSIVMLFTIMSFGSIVSFISLYAVERGIENIGFFFTSYAVALGVFRPLSGRIADKYGYYKVVVPGTIIMALAMYMISVAHIPFLFVVAAATYGIGIGLVMPSMQALTVRNVPSDRRGAANGTFFSSFDIGIGSGALLWGFVVSLVGYSMMFKLTTIPILLGLFIFIKYYKEDIKSAS